MGLTNSRNYFYIKNGFLFHFPWIFYLWTAPHFSESPGARAHKCLDSVNSITWTAGWFLKSGGALLEKDRGKGVS